MAIINGLHQNFLYLNSPYYGVDQAGDEDLTTGYLGEALARYAAAGNKRTAVFKICD